MRVFSALLQFVRQVMSRVFPAKSIESVENIETPLSSDMITALDLWYQMYCNKAPWLQADTVVSLNLPAFIASEIARQVLLEVKWSISSGKTDADGKEVESPRAAYLKAEFEKLVRELRGKLEQGCAAGGMTIRPYPKNGHIYFDYTMAWSLYPVSFDDDGSLKDVIFRDTFVDGKIVYTRLERHEVTEKGIRVTQRAFKSQNQDYIGVEIPLSDVEQWKDLAPEALLTDTEGQMFGWFKVASANNVDVDGPLGVSVFHKAADVIKEADMQYSRLLWEYEASEMAIDVDPTVLRPKAGENGKMEVPKLNQRLFRGVDLGEDSTYRVFNPTIRDASLIAGLNQLLMRIEDLSGLARGTLSDANSEARTATELRILKQRTYATIADNQAAVETCLRDVVRAMDKYATIYKLAPEGAYEVSFEWDDSIITDQSQQLAERMELMSQGVISKVELRQWYCGETEAQAKSAIAQIQADMLAQNVEAVLAASRAKGDATGTSLDD